jgi:hypothetical protein
MNRVLYGQLAAMMGSWLTKPMPRLFSTAGVVPAVGTAVYVGMRADRSVDYVGSVCRPKDATGLATRLREHRARERWRYVVVFPLDPATPSATVRILEGAVGRITRPTRNRRLPSAILLVGGAVRSARARRAAATGVTAASEAKSATT